MRLSRTIYTLAIFVSAFLLFLVQPMAGKMLLPHFGGTPAVWNTCMVFFQTMLLAGYVYAHLGDRWLGSRRQALLHLGVVVAAAFFVPFYLEPGSLVDASSGPTMRVLGLLTTSLGVPFFCLAATAPMLQRWFSRTGDPEADDPYFLYAASNAGSLLALLAYPVVIEAWTAVGTQSVGWAVAFGVEAVLLTACGLVLWRRAEPERGGSESAAAAAEEVESPSARDRFRWTLYAFLPSSLMLGVTTYLTTDIAAVPLLWVVPFVIYLGTFIVAFSRRPTVPLDTLVRALPVVLIPLLFVYGGGRNVTESVWLYAGVHLVGFGLLAMIYHGWLARLRPPATHLTEFFFWVAFGGMLGGMFNGLFAPLVLHWPFEYPVVLIAAALILPAGAFGDLGRNLRSLLTVAVPATVAALVLARLIAPTVEGLPWMIIAVFGVFAIIYLVSHRYPRMFGFAFAVAGLGVIAVSTQSYDVRYMDRNFFGSKSVKETEQLRYLFHGAMIHGAQYRDPDRRDLPVPYYLASGPVGDVFEVDDGRPLPRPVGVIGLGTGGLATYARDGQSWTFFELDPDIAEIAGSEFSYLRRSKGDIEIVVDDGREGLERRPESHFGMIVVDAFSADAIPTHLITREAIQMYVDRLRPDGLLLFHVSNKYVDLRPLLGNTAEELGLVAYTATHDPDKEEGFDDLFAERTMWVAVARSEADLGALPEMARWERRRMEPDYPVWTDDYSNLMGVVR